MAEPEKVESGTVLSTIGEPESSFGRRAPQVRIGTYTQRAGLRLAAGVGTLAAIITLILVVKAVVSLPGTPTLNSGMTSDQLKAVMEAQKANYDHVVGAATGLFDSIIVKALLPVFTSILGYIFGARSSREDDPGDQS